MTTGNQLTSYQFALAAAEMAANTRATNVVVLDLRGKSPVTEFFVIATGTSQRQMRTVADEVAELGKRNGFNPFKTSGYEQAKWILVDFVNVVVHVFDPDSREFYDLELLWGDSPRIDWRKELGLPPAAPEESQPFAHDLDGQRTSVIEEEGDYDVSPDAEPIEDTDEGEVTADESGEELGDGEVVEVEETTEEIVTEAVPADEEDAEEEAVIASEPQTPAEKPKKAPAKKAPAKKTAPKAAKKPAAKKVVAKKPVVKKAAAKKAPAKKVVAKKAKKPVAIKATAKKAAKPVAKKTAKKPAKSVAKKATGKSAAKSVKASAKSAKKPAAKKVPAKKVVAKKAPAKRARKK